MAGSVKSVEMNFYWEKKKERKKKVKLTACLMHLANLRYKSNLATALGTKALQCMAAPLNGTTLLSFSLLL